MTNSSARSLTGYIVLLVTTIAGGAGRSQAAEPPSSPPLVRLPEPSTRPRADGPAKFVDAARGDDAAAGSEQAPWRTIGRALTTLAAGETLYLRGGTYYENVRCAVRGRADAPVTIRSFPGELAAIDGGYPEFFQSPAAAWEPVAGSDDEFRSTRSYGNIRYALGSFGDSFIGLNTYYHAQDLRAKGEIWAQINPDDKRPGVRHEVLPVYCGPGLWYDAATGRIHVRLAHTHLQKQANYEGPTDPRQVPLIVAPAQAVPLRFDGAEHVRVQDLVVRGGGHETVLVEQCDGLEFDNLTIWCASNGLRAYGLRNFHLTHCGLYGNVPPWTFRTDTSLRARPGSGARDITRLNTHALLVPSAMRESDVYAYPQNDAWEIEHCTFADGHDGIYLGGLNVRFHHNLIERTQDDGIYLSPMYASYSEQPFEIHIYQNVIRDCLTALAFGGPEKLTTDRVFIYRNLFQLNTLVPTGRPETEGAEARVTASKPMGDHGSPPWPAMWIYHNTFHMLEPGRSAEHALTSAVAPERPRHLLNNIITAGYRPVVGLKAGTQLAADPSKPLRLPPPAVPDAGSGSSDGNLYWQPGIDAAQSAALFDKYRKSPAFAASVKDYDGGFTSRSVVADPLLDDGDSPRTGSPAIDAGAKIPPEWPDPLREVDAGQPDIGALPASHERPRVGRYEDE